MNIVVKKYGGATLSTADKVIAVAKELAIAHKKGDKLVVVVSAMGQTTNELIRLARQVSSRPKRRELDMLLTTGERISMSLLSMALNDLNTPAISLTGSQAGVLTDDDHLNAFIVAINCPRVEKHLQENKIVIIAGFQGVSPQSKEITTLGRGGSDTTAVAMSAALGARHCEILKDVAGVYTADPKLCPSARPLQRLTYKQILDMTFWGAKVLHYRSVELASTKKVPIYIGPAHDLGEGTWVSEEVNAMYESVKILSINSHRYVLMLGLGENSVSASLHRLQQECTEKEIPFPQVLSIETANTNSKTNIIYLTGPDEILEVIRREIKSCSLINENLATVTATCTGVSTPEISEKIVTALEAKAIKPLRLWLTGMSCTVLVSNHQRDETISTLHGLIE